MTNMIL